jgi:hypothetical protein
LNNNLTVSGITNLISELTVSGITNLNNNLTVSGTTNLLSDLTVSGTTTLLSNLTVSGVSELNNTLIVNGGFSKVYINGSDISNISLPFPTTYDLTLENDKAAKPSTSTWTISSDERLKEDIKVADYDACYQAMSNLELKYYKWRDDINGLSSQNISDRHKLGWIAQDVESVFPKAVDTIPTMFGLTDVKTLNNDQIYACMYGTIKQLMKENKTSKLEIEQLKDQNNSLISRLDILEAIIKEKL